MHSMPLFAGEVTALNRSRPGSHDRTSNSVGFVSRLAAMPRCRVGQVEVLSVLSAAISSVRPSMSMWIRGHWSVRAGRSCLRSSDGASLPLSAIVTWIVTQLGQGHGGAPSVTECHQDAEVIDS